MKEPTDVVYAASPIGERTTTTERGQDRPAAAELAVIRNAQELTSSVANTCRYKGSVNVPGPDEPG